MNGWVIFWLALLDALLVGVVLWLLNHHKAERTGLLKRIEGLNENILTLAKERDAWQSRAHEVETERNELREQVGGLKLERDEALRPKVPPSDGTGKRRVKGKSTSMEPPSTV